MIYNNSLNMSRNMIFIFGIFVFVVIVYYFYDQKERNEQMAPLNFGTFKNNYPRGRCKTGSFKRSDCTVGNCPIGSPISDKQFCYIQCAQGVGKEDTMKCYRHCMGMIPSCR